MSNNNTNSGSIGFTSLLTLVFIVLKLTNVIDWSWWWVLSPSWISIVLTLTILAIVVMVASRTNN
jgi:hypothetical protein